MTICIPKKPFEIASRVIIHVTRLSFIPITFVLFYYANKEQFWGLMLFMIPTCFFQMFFTIIWLVELNDKKHYVKWCDKPKLEKVE